jgi:putative membrane protein
MLLAAGVYPDFIAAVADVTTLRFSRRTVVLLGSVVGAAALAIFLLAGTIKGWVVDYRWVTYSLFVGLTLGGVPLIWRLAGRPSKGLFIGAAAGLGVMLLMVGGIQPSRLAGGPNYVLLVVAGLGGASAMILPGISGAYLLLLLGQYEPILGAVDQLKLGLLGNPVAGVGSDMGLVMQAVKVLAPVGIGVVGGVALVSNLLRWLLRRCEAPTLGVLLGLVVGAVVGLWPFQHGVRPDPGDVVDGVMLAADDVARLGPEDWPVRFFDPGVGQVFTALMLVGVGLAVTVLIDRIGGSRERSVSTESPAS